jgi:hypothetical protein
MSSAAGERTNTDAEVLPRATKSNSTARTRAFRARRRRGVRLIQVRIKETEIEALERLGYLASDRREDAGSIQKAVELLVSDTPLM